LKGCLPKGRHPFLLQLSLTLTNKLTQPATILLCKKGNAHGHAQLYKDCAPYVYHTVKRYISDVEYRKDLVQEIFAKVFININSFDANLGTFNGWIKKISVNECLQYLRKSRPLFISEGLEDNVEITDTTPLPTELKRSDIELILSAMPAGYKLVFMLAVMDGYKHEEISERLNITKETSRSQLTRAKNWIQRNVKQHTKSNLYGLL